MNSPKLLTEVTRHENELLSSALTRPGYRTLRGIVSSPWKPSWDLPEAPSPMLAATRILWRHMQDFHDTSMARSFVDNVTLPFSGLETSPKQRSYALPACKKICFGACCHAETYFSNTASQVEGDRIGKYQTLVSAYYDSSGDPVLLRKAEDESSAMSLRAIEVAGLGTVPAGTLMGIWHMNRSLPAGRLETGRTVYNAYDLEQGSFAVWPTRVMAWAYGDDARKSLFGLDYGRTGPTGSEVRIEVSRYRTDGLLARTLDDFRRTAEQVMQFCGVT